MSKEYVEFLRDENVSNDAGQVLYDLWDTHGKSAPEVMGSVIVDTDSDTDGDGIPDYTDNCLSISNNDQTDADGDGFGSACECDDADSLTYPGAPPAADGKDNNCDGTIDKVNQALIDTAAVGMNCFRQFSAAKDLEVQPLFECGGPKDRIDLFV